jgi:hypothetical protein
MPAASLGRNPGTGSEGRDPPIQVVDAQNHVIYPDREWPSALGETRPRNEKRAKEE